MKYTSMYILNALMHYVDLEILNLYIKMLVVKLLLRWALQLKPIAFISYVKIIKNVSYAYKSLHCLNIIN